MTEQVVKLRYAIGEKFEYTCEEIGKIFKVTRSRIQQLEAKAIRKLLELIEYSIQGYKVCYQLIL